MKHQNPSPLVTLLFVLATVWGTSATLPSVVHASRSQGAADAVRYFNEGNRLFDQGEFEEAVRMFNVAAMLVPDLPGPYRRLGQAYLELNNCNDAVDAFNKYLDLQPDGKFAEQAHEEIKKCRSKHAPQPARPGARVATTGYINLTCSIPEATLVINGNPMGTLPISRLELPVGSHKVTVQKPGYKLWEDTIEITPGAVTNKMVNLQRDMASHRSAGMAGPGGPQGTATGAPPHYHPGQHQYPAQAGGRGRLHLQITPPGATVKINNRPMGQAPLNWLELEAGNHIVRVERDRFAPQELLVTVSAGRDTHASFTLQPATGEQARAGGDTRGTPPAAREHQRDAHRPTPPPPGRAAGEHRASGAPAKSPGAGDRVSRSRQSAVGQVEEPLFAEDRELARRNKTLKATGWSTLALGVGAVAGGIVCGLEALDKEAEYGDAGFTTDRQSIKSSGKKFAAATDALLFGGGALITTGVVLLIKGRTPPNPLDALDMYSSNTSSGGVIVSPLFAPLAGGGAMGLTGRF